jgi:hypothetical protein
MAMSLLRRKRMSACVKEFATISRFILAMLIGAGITAPLIGLPYMPPVFQDLVVEYGDELSC